MRKSKNKEKVNVIMSCKGSIDYIRTHKSKGVFYCPDYDGKILLVENVKGYKEHFFNTDTELIKYIKEVYY